MSLAEPSDPLNGFSLPTQTWFRSSFPAPTPSQIDGWRAIGTGAHTLIHAPTGSGKTLAAFLWTIDSLLTEPVPTRSERCRVLYVSPLKALAYDIDRNLRAPLRGIRHAAMRMGGPELPEITTFLRTGDTPAEDRRRMQRTPPDILITTPESLYLLLTSQARSVLATTRWVIVDEVHAVAGTKRGAHLALSLERLHELVLSANPSDSFGPQRIGLSATQRPLTSIASFLGGATICDGKRTDRPVTIVDADEERRIEIELIVPVEDMSEPGPSDPLEPGQVSPRSIWPSVHPRILELIEQHTSTIVFANSRRLAERLCAELNALAGHEIARSHHGSVSREQRMMIEEALKRGELKAVVATSSLELGIDMGAVDLVIQVEAPVSVTSGLQRVGRAGHQVGETSRAKLFPKYRGDLLVATVVAERMLAGDVEPTVVPRNPIDVLAQQVVAMTIDASLVVDDVYDLVRRAAPFAELPRSVFDATLDMLAGRYPSDLFAELRPRITWDRVEGTIEARPGARQLAVSNPGTIPDRGMYRVVLPDGSRVGELDEEMVYESRQGDVFVLGASTWRIVEIGVDSVEVIPAPGEPGAKMPFWHGDMNGRQLETGRAVGALTREIGALDCDEAIERLRASHHLDELAARNLVAYLAEELETTGVLPTDRTLVVQRFRDEIGDWRVVLLSPLGARVHAPWAMAVTERLKRTWDGDVDVIWSDDGIVFRFPDAEEIPGVDDLVPEPDEVEELLVDNLAGTALFAARFREAAGRSLLLPRRRPGARTPLWLQRRRAAGLLSVAKQFGSFPIVLETYREILQDDFDVPALIEVLGEIRSRTIRLAEVEVPSPSPFATSLLFSFVAAYLYETDTPLAERRAAALSLDRELLAELLGEGELRELLSADVIAAVESELQHLMPERAVRSVDGIHDLLRDLGPMNIDDLELRAVDLDIGEAVSSLLTARRVISVHLGGVPVLAAVEDAGRLRDALGVQPPQGVPFVFLEPVADPLGDIVGRYARTHGPFTITRAAQVLHLAPAVVETVLVGMSATGRVVRGAFAPGGIDVEWVNDDVLRRIKRRSLATLRGEIEPVDEAAFARFLTVWHDIRSGGSGRGALIETIRRLQGVDIPASVLERDVLADRVGDIATSLDQLMLEGEVVWVGRSALGAKDGRLALYFRHRLPLLLRTSEPADRPSEPLHETIRGHLEARGASFFAEIYTASGGGDPDRTLDALWDLVWAGEVTNDTLAPVRAFWQRRPTGRRRLLPSSFPSHASGRWSLVSTMVGSAPNPTERAAAEVTQLLDRNGILTRSVVAAEGVPGGFTALYPLLSRLEETGQIRRGYFVEGLGGAQFAAPGAVDRLRATATTGIVVLAATDPANAYGATLPWPETNVRLARQAGAYVILIDGALMGYIERGGRSIHLWGDEIERIDELADAIVTVARRYRRFAIHDINASPPTGESGGGLGAALTDRGFVTGPKGLVWRSVRAVR